MRIPLHFQTLSPAGRVLLAGTLLAAIGLAQSGKCPRDTALTEDQVKALVGGEQDRAVELIRSCHVTFVLHPDTRADLEKAGASAAELNAVEQESFARMTWADAHREVDEYVEPEIQKIRDASEAKKKEQLDQSDRDYQTARQPLQDSLNEPKGPLDSTADYQARLSRTRQSLDQLELRHRDDQSAIRRKFDDEAHTQSQSLAALEASLKARRYPMGGVSIQVDSYDADRGILIANIDGAKYRFAVRSDLMKKIALVNGTALSMREEVSLRQPFEDTQASRTRYIQAPALIGELQIPGTPVQPEAAPPPAPVPNVPITPAPSQPAPQPPVRPAPPPPPPYTGAPSGSLPCTGLTARSGADLMLPMPLPHGLTPANVQVDYDRQSWANYRLSSRADGYHVVLTGYRKPGENSHPNCAVQWKAKP